MLCQSFSVVISAFWCCDGCYWCCDYRLLIFLVAAYWCGIEAFWCWNVWCFGSILNSRTYVQMLWWQPIDVVKPRLPEWCCVGSVLIFWTSMMCNGGQSMLWWQPIDCSDCSQLMLWWLSILFLKAAIWCCDGSQLAVVMAANWLLWWQPIGCGYGSQLIVVMAAYWL